MTDLPPDVQRIIDDGKKRLAGAIKVALYRHLAPQVLRNTCKTSDAQIWGMWKRQKMNTYDIAVATGIPEHEVESRLWRIRDAMREAST